MPSELTHVRFVAASFEDTVPGAAAELADRGIPANDPPTPL